MSLLDYDTVRDFYNSHLELWHNDLFSRMTTRYIDTFVSKAICRLDCNSVLLNIGSGGKTYNTQAKQVHLDIAENTLKGVQYAYVGNIIDMPFEDETFDCVVCVGTVINYCEATKGLSEIGRVSKKHARLILEYERSGSGLVNPGLRDSDIVVFNHSYFDEPHKNLLYSDDYIRSLLRLNGFVIKSEKKFNTTIPLIEMFSSEEIAHKMAIFEFLFRALPFINKYSHNEIMICQKI